MFKKKKKIDRTDSSRFSPSVNRGQSNHIDSTFLPQDLTVGLINQIGNQYIKNHPTSTSDHRNQLIAHELIEYTGGTPQKMFAFLADKYEKLHGDSTGEIAQQILTLYRSFERGIALFPEAFFKEEKERARKERNGSPYLNVLGLSKSYKPIQKSDFTISILSRDYMEGDNTMDKVARDMKRMTRDYFIGLEWCQQASSKIEIA